MEKIFFVKFIGYFMFFTGSSLFFSKAVRTTMLNKLKNNDVFLIIMGCISILIGLPIIILHNIWDFSVLGLVTLMGWLALIKGVIFLIKPSIVRNNRLTEKNLKVRGMLSALIGLGLICYVYFWI